MSLISLFKGPGITEKIDMLFKDVKTEGKTQGYKRAASEYEKSFREIENEYKHTKNLIKSQKINYGNSSEELIVKLSELEKKKKSLEEQLEKKMKAFSVKNGIPIGDVRRYFVATGTFGNILPTNPTTSLLDLIYIYKKKNLAKVEQTGYLEARELYEEKISKMKEEFQGLQNNSNADIKKLLDMISDLFDAIAEEQMKIANLNILLQAWCIKSLGKTTEAAETVKTLIKKLLITY